MTDHNVPYYVPHKHKQPGRDKRTITVPVEQVIVDDRQRPLNEVKVLELMVSIYCLGLLNPILIVVREREDEGVDVVLVAGRHRLQAVKQLRHDTIQCTVLEDDDDVDALLLELAGIDENIVRHDPSPAKHALLTLRRDEIVKKLSDLDFGTLSQIATASKQALQRAGQSTGHDIASVRDQAKRTGESKDKIQRSRMRGRILGDDLLDRIVGTSLDKGVELDALAKLPEAERDDLANCAAAGEVVSARTADRRPQARPDRKVKLSRRDQALAEFHSWKDKYSDLDVLARLTRQISEIELALSTDNAER